MKDGIKNEEVLSEEQQKLISKNMGLLDAFYKTEIGKGYIPDQKKDDFFSNLQQRFCNAALKYNEDAGFKFSTFAYGSFIFCAAEMKKKLFRDRKVFTGNDKKFVSYGKKSVWNSINGWDVDSVINYEKVVNLVNKVPLSEKERTVINFYYFEGLTLLETGKKLGLSRQRIKQITLEAIYKIKRFADRRDYRIGDFVKYGEGFVNG